MQLNSVDLPEPFGPMMPRISPSRTSNETPSTACDAAEALADVRDFEDRRHHAVSSTSARQPPGRRRGAGSAIGEEAVEDAEQPGGE